MERAKTNKGLYSQQTERSSCVEVNTKLLFYTNLFIPN